MKGLKSKYSINVVSPFSLLHAFIFGLPTVDVLCPSGCPCSEPLSVGLFSTDNVQSTVLLQLGKQFMESQDWCCSVMISGSWKLSELDLCAFPCLLSRKHIRVVFLKALAATRIALLSCLSGPHKWAVVLLQPSSMGRAWPVSCCFSSSLFSLLCLLMACSLWGRVPLTCTLWLRHSTQGQCGATILSVANQHSSISS